jgi:hypothetical protein
MLLAPDDLDRLVTAPLAGMVSFMNPAIPNITAKSPCTTQSVMFHALGAERGGADRGPTAGAETSTFMIFSSEFHAVLGAVPRRASEANHPTRSRLRLKLTKTATFLCTMSGSSGFTR